MAEVVLGVENVCERDTPMMPTGLIADETDEREGVRATTGFYHSIEK